MAEARRWRALFPGANDYRELPRTWRGDLVAGVTVGIVALPLALAFGVSSGVGAEAGLVTAVIAGFVAAVFGGSNVQVSGPTGAMVVVLLPIAALHGASAMVWVCLLAGTMVLVIGALGLGRLIGVIPWPVIEGFTLGIAIIIFLQQVPSAIGSEPGSSTNAFVAAVQSFAGMDRSAASWTVGIVAVVAAIMVIAPRLHPQLPGSIIAIVATGVGAAWLGLPIARIGELPTSLPSPSLPPFDIALISSLLGPAAAVAALAAIESLLAARVAASISDTGPYHADRELVGQGLASIAAGFFGGMPATGAIARTAVSIRAGGRTRLAAIVHATVLLGVIYLASTVVSQIPLAALSGVLMVTAVRMVSGATVRSVLRSSRSDATVFVVTALVTVAFDLVIAVGIGIAVAAFVTLRKLSSASGVLREELPGPAAAGDERIALFRIHGALFFGDSDRLMRDMSGIDNASVVIIRMSQLTFLDASGAHLVAELVTQLERRGITVLVKGIQERHRALTAHVGVVSSLRHRNHLFDDLADAVEHARSHIVRESA